MNEWSILERCRNSRLITRQQYKTIKGQLRAGDTEGAIKGLKKLVERVGGEDLSQQKSSRPAERKKLEVTASTANGSPRPGLNSSARGQEMASPTRRSQGR